MDYSTPISSVVHYLPELLQFMFIELVMLSNHLIFCHPVLLLPSIFPSIKVFCKRSFSPLHIRWPKYWSFSFSVSPPNEYSGFISSRNEWFDLLAVQRTLKSLLQHNSSKTSILWCLAFFMVQLSHLCTTTEKRSLWLYAQKNWCFWTVVLERTLENPLDCKEIQPVHPKGDQSWLFTG